MDKPDSATVAAIARDLRESENVLFITGAGLSADSGLPTYRGKNGLYRDGNTIDGIPIEEALSYEVMHSRPDIVWRHLMQVEQASRGARFNRGHEVIVEIEQALPRVWTLTQNIDSFHFNAGSEKLIEIHGNNKSLKCMRCEHRQRAENFSSLEIPPPCPACSEGILRPDVVLFGEMLPEDKIDLLYSELDRGFDMVFSVGTTSVFPYIAYPMQLGRQRGWTTVEINPDDTSVSDLANYRLKSTAAASLDEIWSTFHHS